MGAAQPCGSGRPKQHSRGAASSQRQASARSCGAHAVWLMTHKWLVIEGEALHAAQCTSGSCNVCKHHPSLQGSKQGGGAL